MTSLREPFSILYQDDDVLAIDKPAGYFVHPPEEGAFRVPRNKIVLHQLRTQIRRFIYPIHHLDAGTSGVLIWGLHFDAASALNRSFRQQEVKKTYQAVVRGFVQDEFTVDLELDNDRIGSTVDAVTDFRKLGQVEFNIPVGKKYPSARYSWILAHPRTGRFHQIRRHLNRISHPILGDADHGDSRHNRFFREQLGVSGLCLRAYQLEFAHPRTGEPLKIQAPIDEKWRRIESVFQGAVTPVG